MGIFRKPPTRFWIGVMIFFGAYINFATRSNIPISIVTMVKSPKKSFRPECKRDNIVQENDTSYYPDYGPRYEWDEIVQGNIISSYFWGYVAATLPSGTIAEWLGPSTIIFWFTLIAAILNALCVPAAWLHYSLLIFLRFCMGLLGTFVYPSFQVLIAKWAPPLEKGKFSSAMMGNALSSIINWPLLTSITVNFGWDWGFYVVSMQLLIFCAVFWFICSDSPEKHPFISEAEIEYIKTCQAGKITSKRRKPPYGRILANKPFWVLAFCHTGSMWGLYLQMNGMPKYIVEVVGFNLQNAGSISMLPHLFRVFVALATGAVADWLVKKEIITSKGMRKTFCFFSHFLPGILTIGIAFCGCNIAVIIFILVGLGINGATVVTNLLNPQDLAPNFSGTIFGLISFFAGIAGFMVPLVTGLCIREHNGIKEWGLNFYIGGVIYLMSGVVFMLFGSVDEQDWNRPPGE